MYKIFLFSGVYLLLVSNFVLSAEQIDPTRPLGKVVGVQSRSAVLQLNSILISSGRKIAIINGKEVEVNDRVGGARVTEIHADRVVVYRQSEEIVLKLYRNKLREKTTNKVSGR